MAKELNLIKDADIIVRSGDSYVVGIAIAIQRRYNVKDALKFVSACETENAMEERSGFVTESIVNDLFNKIIIEELI